ncbi:hypothetical protein F5X96DRAFT_675032 [Biscogniauxia mediterranea]|nr:hypothetical protein F5X96DRAFT_675032 [Biscogniauxia mediterranea]
MDHPQLAGILTFVVAIAVAVYTESQWLAEIVKTAGDRLAAEYQTEYQMYLCVMDGLLQLEKRLLRADRGDLRSRPQAGRNRRAMDAGPSCPEIGGSIQPFLWRSCR